MLHTWEILEKNANWIHNNQYKCYLVGAVWYQVTTQVTRVATKMLANIKIVP